MMISLRTCLLLAVSLSIAGKASAGQPNVVFLLSDDQSWTDYGFMGHPQLKTPRLDELARQGLVYERGYVTAPLCRPSLASIVTGMYPHQTGIRGNDPLLPEGVSRLAKEDKPVSTQFRDRMTAPMLKHPTFVKELKKNGYATLQTGKWWEGDPKDHGFTDAMTHGDHSRGGRHGDDGLQIGRGTMDPIYDFVDAAKANSQPFFIWYGVFLPHSPHNAPDRLYEKYKDIAPDEATARYWANVEWLDEGCGQIVDHLKKQGLYEDTIFIFTCDNGWVVNPERVGASMRSKREPVEAGIRTPIFITHGNKIAPQRDSETLASNIDVATTILRACDIEVPATMEGLDLRDPEELKKRDRIFVDVYAHDSRLDKLDDLDDGMKARVVIDGWDKLILTPSRNQLFDLKNDVDDRVDLADKNPELTERLVGVIKDWVGQ